MKKYIIICMAAAAMLLSSCSKEFLNTQDQNEVDQSVALGSVDNIEKSMLGLYRNFISCAGTFYSPFSGYGTLSIYNDIAGGIMSRPNATQYYNYEYNFSYHINNSLSTGLFAGPWEYCYGVIRGANQIINAAPNLTPKENEIAKLNDVIAQAKTMRALMYHTLNVLYSPRYDANKANSILSVPLKTTSETTNIKRSTQAEVIAFILNDLKEAVELFEKGEKSTTSSIATMNAAKMIQARVFMYTYQYDEALTAAKYIIDNPNGKSIMGTTEYYKGFNEVTNKEWIFGGIINANNNRGFMSFIAQIGTNTSGYYNPRTSPLIMDMTYMLGINPTQDVDSAKESFTGLSNTVGLTMDPSDDRYEIFIAQDADGIKANLATNPSYYNTYLPFAGNLVCQGRSKKFSAITRSTYIADLVVMRLAEAYYIAAEAAALTNNDALAKTYLAATITPYDSDFNTSESGDRLKTLIANYKKVDMWGEGRSLEDVKRRGEWVYRVLKYNPTRFPRSRQFSSIAPYMASGIEAAPAADYMTLPIATQIMMANPLLVRNSF